MSERPPQRPKLPAHRAHQRKRPHRQRSCRPHPQRNRRSNAASQTTAARPSSACNRQRQRRQRRNRPRRLRLRRHKPHRPHPQRNRRSNAASPSSAARPSSASNPWHRRRQFRKAQRSPGSCLHRLFRPHRQHSRRLNPSPHLPRSKRSVARPLPHLSHRCHQPNLRSRQSRAGSNRSPPRTRRMTRRRAATRRSSTKKNASNDRSPATIAPLSDTPTRAVTHHFRSISHERYAIGWEEGRRRKVAGRSRAPGSTF